MPSSSIIKCVPIKNIREHPNADNLLILDIMAWQVITNKDTNPNIGDLRIYVPPDSILPDSLVNELDIRKYLKTGNRVGQVKLRGELSFGLAIENQWGFAKGEDVAEQLGITRWEPPMILGGGDQERNHPLFNNYFRIENWRNFATLFKETDLVVYLEKLHGTNSKVGLVREEENSLLYMVGSHSTRRKIIDDPTNPKRGIYQFPLDIVSGMLKQIIDHFTANVVIVYGEIFGRVQDLKYGYPNSLAYRAFDIYVDGKFLDWGDAVVWFNEFKVPYVPVLFNGNYSEDSMKHYANQNTVLLPPDKAHISEGVVIRPLNETYDKEIGGRKILKYKSIAYEERCARGKGTEFQ